MRKRTVDATQVRKGDRIKFRWGITATVTRPSERREHNTVRIYTDKGVAVTTLPCPVTVIEET